MDRIEAKEHLQAAALGCLDSHQLKELKELLEFDSELQFELAAYQTLCAMIPFSLEIINPDDTIKDSVALRLKKIEEELRAKREAELKEKMPEVKIEDTTIINEEIKSAEISVEDLSSEISQETSIEPGQEQLEIEPPEVIEAQLPESYLAEDVTKTEDIPEIPLEEEIFSFDDSEPKAEFNSLEEPEPNPVQEEIENLNSFDSSPTSVDQSEEIKYEEPKPVEKKNVVESFEGKVKVDHSYSESKFSDITSRTVAEKLQKSFQMDLESMKRAIENSEKKTFKMIISLLIVTAVLIALLIFFFFKFSADIKRIEKEMELMKNTNSQGVLIGEQRNSLWG